MIKIIKTISCIVAIFICNSCYASYLTISIEQQNKGNVVYKINGKQSSFNALKKQLVSYNDKNQIILVRVNEKISIGDIFIIFTLIKKAGFKEIILNSSKTETKNSFSYMHIPIQLKDIKLDVKEIPIPSPPE